jgi:acetyl-CoA carboxylase biotin carboxyl carrier protein
MSKGQIINMDQQRIKQLIDLLAESDLSEMTLSEAGTTVTLSRHATAAAAVPQSREVSPSAVAESSPASEIAAPIDVPTTRQICSPLYGVLHLTPSPQESPFTSLGATVAVGQTLCVVEAMKMFHQVKATQAGRLDAILAQAGDEVESGQPLFSIV